MKGEYLHIRVTKEEKELIVKLAGKKTMTDFIIGLVKEEKCRKEN